MVRFVKTVRSVDDNLLKWVWGPSSTGKRQAGGPCTEDAGEV